jgi:hypothetical protein
MIVDRRAAYYRKLPHQHDPENFLARYDRGLQLQAQWRAKWKRP